MFNYRGKIVIPNLPAREQLFINSVLLYAYNAADVMANEDYSTLLKSFLTVS